MNAAVKPPVNLALLRTQGLCLRRSGRLLLDHISLHIPPARLSAVLGPAAAGKSCLLRTLAGHLEPDSGEVWLGRHSLASLGRAEQHKRLLLLDDRLLFPAQLTVGEVMGWLPRSWRWRWGARPATASAGAFALLSLGLESLQA